MKQSKQVQNFLKANSGTFDTDDTVRLLRFLFDFVVMNYTIEEFIWGQRAA